jgi:flavin-dependent dehydrogenase
LCRADEGVKVIDALVVGGGPAGASVATRLARCGRQVVLLERETGPHDKVCGEFLSQDASSYLASLGVEIRALGAAPIEALRLARGRSVVSMKLPFPAYSLSRRVLDTALLARAASAGATIRLGSRVEALARCAGGYRARLEDGTTLHAREAFLATGKHDLRGWRRPAGLQNDLLAFKLYVRLEASQARGLEGHVELVLFEGGYAGLQPVEGGRANLCLLVRRRRFAALGQRWANLLSEIQGESLHLEERLRGAEPCWARPLALGSIPYGYVRREGDGPFRLGDQAAVIPSFAGDGMAIALHSAELAAQASLAGGGPEVFQKRLARDVGGQVLLATGLSHGLVRRSTQTALNAAAGLLPRLVATIAWGTRVPAGALTRARLDGAR